MILAICFFVISVVLIKTLKNYYPIFYVNVKVKLWLAAVFLSFPLIVRTVFNLVRDFTPLDDEIYESEINNTWLSPWYNLILFLFADVLPIAA